MAFYFVAIVATVILAQDMSGVPDDLLVSYLRDSTGIHAVPNICTLLGLVLMAAGYGIDLNERLGCGSGISHAF